MKTLLLLGVSLLLTAGSGFAGTIFDITLNDGGFDGAPGAISLQLAATGSASSATAGITNVTGSTVFGAVDFTQNATGSLPGNVTLTSGATPAELFQFVTTFQTPLQFRVNLATASASPVTFSVQFLNDNYGAEAVIDWDGSAWSVSSFSEGVDVSQVPEPGSVALTGAGIAAVLWLRRRRQAR